jgi:tRNA pseudouridine38-40 synthase
MPPAETDADSNPSSAAYKSIVAYDGTDFEGFQRQAIGHRTVQGELESALTELGWRGRSLLAAGRTDQGVHASGQVIGFQLDWRHDPQDLTRALNATLPQDIAVRQTEAVSSEFHPRFSAVSRRYQYSIRIDATRDPLIERYAWRLESDPDLELIRGCSADIVGERDFGAFGSAPVEGGHTRRTVTKASWSATGSNLIFEIEANAFLYHMVRRIVVLLVAIGQGQEKPSTLQQMLNNPAADWQGGLAPARGLCLANVRYDPE